MAISKKAGAKKGARAGGAAPAPAGRKPYAPGGVAKADWREGFKKPQAGVSDMTLLSQVTNEAINANLKKRFFNQEIYTYIGNVLISVNPFRDLGLYTTEMLESYRGKNRLEMRPHVYSIAEGMFYNMQAYHENQCVIISGESGAGKTEAAKQIMQYIAAVSGDQGGGIENVKQMVLATNPLLESFGCAKTLRNNNSSRHGKYLEIMFNAQGAPIGANITNYLLEKNRVVGQIKTERNFHIFYQLAKGASPTQREMFGLQGPEAYHYTAGAKCLDVDGIDDTADFQGTIQAMNVIGLSQTEQDSIFRMIAAILWLGNTQFVEDKDGNAQVADTSVTDYVAYLLEVDAAAIHRALTIRIMETMRGMRRGSVYEVPLNPAQAESVRDALAKAIYNNLFDWIVTRVNQSMQTQGSAANVIGVLDIYGFEIFDNNSFEQLCINYVNEKLQQIFIQLTLKREQEEYAAEEIQWTPIKFFNNKIVCDLIEEKRPPGIFSALNDACATAHADPKAADQSFSQRLSMLSSNAHFDGRGNKFLVRHYAGDVMYNINGMTDKNKDALLKDILDLVDSSQNQFLHALFPDRPDPTSKKRPPTAGDRIKSSANALVEKLMRSQPSYIRTIKPNQTKQPTDYDDQQVLHQVKYLGLQENIRVRRAGFAYRNSFEKMVERFYLLSPNTSYAGEYTWEGDARSGCEQILTDTGIARDEWQMGRTKAFIKNPETLFALETMRDRYWHNMAMRIQRAFRNYLRYKHECARRIQRMWLNKKEAIKYVEFRDYGHQLLRGQKERRRFSLVSMRKFVGDYLDVNGGSVEGDLLRRAAGIGSTPVTFSARGQILVHRTLRAPRPSPRFLLLTQKELLIVVTQLVNKQPTTMLERKIPLASIAQVGLSQLRDDWIVLNLRGQDMEGDPVLHCYLKTELATRLARQTNGNIGVNLSNTLDYGKKKGKRAQIAFRKDETIPRDDEYKSHAVHVPSGEPAGSVSRPPARRKPGAVRPVTTGKLLKAGGPSNPNQHRSRPAAASRGRPVPKGPRALPGSSATNGSAVAAPTSVRASMGNGARASTTSTPRAPPPPPAPPAPVPEPEEEEEESNVPLYKALYDFAASSSGEMGLVAGEVVEVEQHADNGWWLVKKNGVEAWAPSAYLELIPPKPKKPKVRRAPPAPAPAPVPAPRPVSTSTPKSFQPVQSSVRAETAHAVPADTSAAPVAVMPGMGATGGFAEVLAKKKAAIAAANGVDGVGSSSGRSSSSGPAGESGASTPSRPPIPPKPKPGAGRKVPPPPPRR